MMTSPELKDILNRVSRSFYLTLWILPARIRPQLGIAYLFCRTADTIADAPRIPRNDRLRHLGLFRGQFLSAPVSLETVEKIKSAITPLLTDPGEQRLLAHLPDCFRAFLDFSVDDQTRIRTLVSTLIKGMEMDLNRFPADPGSVPAALADEAELDQYCYYVAGVVGEFWTRMAIAHFPSMKHWDEETMCRTGLRFGKGLQMTNILKDLSKDLSRGRCYIPTTALEKEALKPADLTRELPGSRIRPLLLPFIRLTLNHLNEGWRYIMLIPRTEVRLRLACLWPHLFALKTLREIYSSPSLLDPDLTVKIPRRSIYETLIRTGLLCFSNKALGRYAEGLKRKLHFSMGSAESA